MKRIYDSTKDTKKHIEKVKNLCSKIACEISLRGVNHDKSKLEFPEKKGFDEETPKLKTLTYNSKKYKESLERLGVALRHHYKNNRHHPEHFSNGINGMNLVDICEMLCDWISAVERTKDGDILKSIEINQKRFGYSDDLKQVLINTVRSIKWPT